ncbi:serine/threonine-protein phosphatase BSL3 [Tanacetum coccineum]
MLWEANTRKERFWPKFKKSAALVTLVAALPLKFKHRRTYNMRLSKGVEYLVEASEAEAIAKTLAIAKARYWHTLASPSSAETGGALGGMVRQLSIDQFENEGRRVSYGTPENATAARKLLDRQMSISSVPKKVIAHLLKPRGWKPPVRRQFFLDCNEIADLCDSSERWWVAGGAASGMTTVCDMIIEQLHDQRLVLMIHKKLGMIPKNQPLFMLDYNCDKYYLEVYKFYTISDVKAMIGATEDVSPCNQSLFFAWMQLKVNCTLYDYNIYEKYTLDRVLHLFSKRRVSFVSSV